MSGLKYIGKGSIRDVPADDLSEEEVEKYGGEDYLIATKLYEKPKAKANKMRVGGKENK